jgi:excisionase family DNA binding protein
MPVPRLVNRADRGDRGDIAIQDLSTHPRPFVSVRELCQYWGLSRHELYKQIEAGTLPAVRLGPRLYRVRTADAVRFAISARLRVA